MSKDSWRHAICNVCWYLRYPDKLPVKLRDPDEETCCFCHRKTRSGIYVRADPTILHPPDVVYEGDV